MNTPDIFVPMEIDEQKALERIGGMKDLYRELLEYALEIKTERWTDIEESLVKEDYKKYRLLVHSLKGAMLSLGLNELADVSQMQEDACSQERYEDVRRQHTEFARQYERGHKSIEYYLSGGN